MNPILQLQQVTGGYQRKRPVIHELTFDVFPGEMVGLIGLNGAGKSTTIQHILGLLEPMEGRISVNQQTLEDAPEAYRMACGYVPETPQVYEDLTLWEHFELTAMAYQLERKQFELRANELLAEFMLEEKRDLFPRQLSKGMRQKLMLMTAFLVQPKLYIIDEPFVGLDPIGMRSLLERMVATKRTGAGILMSSHVLATIERYCDRFIILHHGRILAQGSLQDIRTQLNQPSASLDDLFFELTTGDSQ